MLIESLRSSNKSVDKNIITPTIGAKIKCVESANGLLSLKEKEVLQLMAGGLTDLEIANQLFFARATIKHYQSSIYSKVGGLKVKAVAWGIRNGEIDTVKAVDGLNVNLVISLSERKREILEAMFNGEATTNREINQKFGITMGGARRVVARMLNVTGARNRSQLIALYAEAKRFEKIFSS